MYLAFLWWSFQTRELDAILRKVFLRMCAVPLHLVRAVFCFSEMLQKLFVLLLLPSLQSCKRDLNIEEETKEASFEMHNSPTSLNRPTGPIWCQGKHKQVKIFKDTMQWEERGHENVICISSFSTHNVSILILLHQSFILKMGISWSLLPFPCSDVLGSLQV